MDAGRILEPLGRARIERLERYQSQEELAAALLDTSAAVEHSLRLLLRADTQAADELRVAALSPSDLPPDRLLAVLRERDRISLGLAGRIHELRQAAARAETGSARAADADLARGTVQELRAEIHAGSDAAVREAAHHAVEDGPLEETQPVPPPSRRVPMGLVISAAGLLIVVLAVTLLLVGRGPALTDAVAAFERGDRVQAGVLLRRILEKDPEDATALLYLARIERRAGRHEAAADYLRRAAGVAPGDADVRRELGHLFMELGRPAAAAEQYGRAVELAPEGTLGWVGWVRALREAGDSLAAADVLRRAPREARAVLTGGQTRP